MSYRDPDGKRDVGNMIAGLFLGCFGLFGVLLGGGCGVMFIGMMTNARDLAEGSWIILIALAVFAGGAVALYQGIRMLSGRD